MIHKVEHRASREILIPYAALHNNLDFIKSDKGQKVKFEDEKDGVVEEYREVHILDPEFKAILEDVYRGMGYDSFLNRWYQKLGNNLRSMMFMYIKIKIK